MFCPQCGTTQSEEIRFCKQCGANMYAVRQLMSTREAGEKFDWSKTWVAEMFLSHGERKKREQELERQRGITPEVKRYTEIKAGVITSCVGIGVAVFLYVFAQGIVAAGHLAPDEAELIRRLWVAGVIPFFVGLGLLINGLLVSRKLADLAGQELRPKATTAPLEKSNEYGSLPPADWSGSVPPDFSVTEDATRQLRSSGQKQ